MLIFKPILNLTNVAKCSIITTKGDIVGLPKSVRVDDELEKKIEAYLDKNPVKFSQLVAMALEKFISEPQMIALKPISDSEYLEIGKKAFKKHKHTMDKLK